MEFIKIKKGDDIQKIIKDLTEEKSCNCYYNLCDVRNRVKVTNDFGSILENEKDTDDLAKAIKENVYPISDLNDADFFKVLERQDCIVLVYEAPITDEYIKNYGEMLKRYLPMIEEKKKLKVFILSEREPY